MPRAVNCMIFPQLARFTDVALLFMRIIVGIVFMTSGWEHLQDPQGRSKDIQMSKGFTIFLGAAEFAGGLGVILGVLAQPAAFGLILITLGAIQRRFSSGTLVSGEVRVEWLELRHNACGNESGYRHHRWWQPLSDEPVPVARLRCSDTQLLAFSVFCIRSARGFLLVEIFRAVESLVESRHEIEIRPSHW